MSNLALSSATKENPLAYGISYVDLLEGKKWDLSRRKWSVELYQAANPYLISQYPDEYARSVVMMKPTQIGMSTLSIVKMFHFADNFPARVMYILPRQQDYLDFVTTRVDPMIKRSARLSALLGSPDSTRAKQFGQSYLFFMESTVEPRMMPADALFMDEVDLCNPDNLGTAQNRLDDSKWKLKFWLSTPTIPNYGVHSRYLQSDMRTWLIRCKGCGFWQPVEWESNLKVYGADDAPEKVQLECVKCAKVIDMETIQAGKWVAERPDRSKDIVGYHVSQLMVHDVATVYKAYLDPETTTLEFWRKRLGKPYELAGGSVSREDILGACYDDTLYLEPAYDGKSTYFMGVDQGNELQVVIAKTEPNSRRLKVIHIEFVPYSAEVADNNSGFNRIANLIRQYRVKTAVIDADPNRHSVRALQQIFPGTVFLADYLNIKTRVEKITGRIGKMEGVTIGLKVNRTEGLDYLMQTIRDGLWQLPTTAGGAIPTMVENLISHVTALKRDVEEKRTPSGMEQEAVWRTIRPDHLAHSMLFLKLGVDMRRANSGKIAIIGTGPSATAVEQPTEDATLKVMALLAEVPQVQVQEFLKDPESLAIPFPLSHKLPKALEEFSKEDVFWVLRHIATFGNAPIPKTREERILRFS